MPNVITYNALISAMPLSSDDLPLVKKPFFRDACEEASCWLGGRLHALVAWVALEVFRLWAAYFLSAARLGGATQSELGNGTELVDGKPVGRHVGQQAG